MKKFNKVLAVVLAVLMLMMTSVTAFADYARFPLNESLDCYMEAGDSWTLTFTTRSEGWYVLNGYLYEDGADPYVRVSDSDGYEIVYADDSAYGSRECEAWFYAERGKTYYIEVGNYGYTDDGIASVSFYLEKENEYSHVCCWDYDEDGYCDWCDYQLCDHNCHKGGIVGFFWSITNFFNMIFGLNEVCDCGVYHW